MTVTYNGKELKEIPDGIDIEISSEDKILFVHMFIDGVTKIYYRHLDENDVKFPFPLDASWKVLE